MIRLFVYVHRIAEISLFSGKNTGRGSIIFSLKTIYLNPNFQNNIFFYPVHEIQKIS